MLSWLVVLAGSGLLLWLVKPHRLGGVAPLLGAAPAGAAFVWLLTEAVAYDADTVATHTITWIPRFGLDLMLRLDGLGLFFGLIITGIGTAIGAYASGYFGPNPRLGYFYFLLYSFMVAMLGLVWADNLLALFSFWEATSITSFLLIGFSHTKVEARAGARRSLVVTGLGGLAMLGGFVVLGQGAGTFTISEIVATPDLTEVPGFAPAMFLIMIGAFTKSAQFPFHFWLPGAMAAPTPASAYLHSATMVKAGVYLLARLHPGMASSELWFWTLAIVGGITMLVGATHALGQTDLKALLAYATVSQLGVLVFLLAFDDETAYKALVVGILAHALYKGPLFMVAGIIDLSTGTRRIDRLAGLSRRLPVVTGVAALSAVSMAGLPPTFGFLAKETLIEVPLHAIEHDRVLAGALGLLAAAVSGAFFVAYSGKLLWEPFFRRSLPPSDGDSTPEPAAIRRSPNVALTAGPVALAVVGTITPFVLPWIEDWLLAPAAADVAGESVKVEPRLWLGFTLGLGISTVVIATGYVLFRYREPVGRAVLSYPSVLGGQRVFDRLYNDAYRLARLVTYAIQRRSIGTHTVVVLTLVVASLAYALVVADPTNAFDLDLGQRPRLHELIIAALAVGAALATLRTSGRLNQIITVGVVGVMVTIMFVDFSGPDLALTQLAVDVLTVVLLVLVFYRIPPDVPPQTSSIVLWRNRAVAVGMGLFGFAVVAMAGTPSEFVPISEYHKVNSGPLAQGGNIVNVILVDFRAFDTFGEITVLAIAALGGYVLFRSSRLSSLAPGHRSTDDDVGSEETDATPEPELQTTTTGGEGGGDA